MGIFETEKEAALAYDAKARELKGPRAYTNFDESGIETSVRQLEASTHPLVCSHLAELEGREPIELIDRVSADTIGS